MANTRLEGLLEKIAASSQETPSKPKKKAAFAWELPFLQRNLHKAVSVWVKDGIQLISEKPQLKKFSGFLSRLLEVHSVFIKTKNQENELFNHEIPFEKNNKAPGLGCPLCPRVSNAPLLGFLLHLALAHFEFKIRAKWVQIKQEKPKEFSLQNTKERKPKRKKNKASSKLQAPAGFISLKIIPRPFQKSNGPIEQKAEKAKEESKAKDGRVFGFFESSSSQLSKKAIEVMKKYGRFSMASFEQPNSEEYSLNPKSNENGSLMVSEKVPVGSSSSLVGQKRMNVQEATETTQKKRKQIDSDSFSFYSGSLSIMRKLNIVIKALNGIFPKEVLVPSDKTSLKNQDQKDKEDSKSFEEAQPKLGTKKKEFLAFWDKDEKSLVTSFFCKKKNFFHSKPMMVPFDDQSVFEESEDELENEELRILEEDAIDEYLDIHDSDKACFKAWNNFIWEHEKETIRKMRESSLKASFEESKCKFQPLNLVELSSKFISENMGTLGNKRDTLLVMLSTLFINNKIPQNSLTDLMNAFDSTSNIVCAKKQEI